MKTIFTLAIVLISCISYAQNALETEAVIAGGKRNAIVVSIPKADQKTIEKEWKNLMKKYKADVTVKDEIFANNAIIKSITDNSMDVYARVDVVKDGEVQLIVAFDLGGYYLSSMQQPELYKEAKKMIEKFAKDQSKTAYKDYLQNEEKILSDLERERKKLENQVANMQKQNEDYQKKIKDNEQKIRDNQTAIENKTKEIDNQDQKVKSIKDEKGKY
jgi:hypothetical protein